MQVETFECEETATEPVELTVEAMEMIEQLGLVGQKRLVNKDVDGTPARCPYRKITAEESFVYRSICPVETKLKDFDEEPIPVRVLQVATHAKSLNMFTELRVWHRSSVSVKDPVLIGFVASPGYSWTGDTYILARWGEVLDEWPALVKTAMAKWRESVKAQLAKNISLMQADIAALDAFGIEEAVKSETAPQYVSLR